MRVVGLAAPLPLPGWLANLHVLPGWFALYCLLLRYLFYIYTTRHTHTLVVAHVTAHRLHADCLVGLLRGFTHGWLVARICAVVPSYRVYLVGFCYIRVGCMPVAVV